MIEITLGDWEALDAATAELRRATDGPALLLDGTGALGATPGATGPAGRTGGDAATTGAAGTTGTTGAAAAALARVRRLRVPTFVALDGARGAVALAAALACDHAVAGPGTRIAVADAATLLRLRIPAALVARAGDLHAHRLLLSADPLDAEALGRAGLALPATDPLAAAREAADRATSDPHAALLRRSLSAATRSTAAQAADYEAELVALL
jgi:enoyl-CoA hydratase/carnithine racemase